MTTPAPADRLTAALAAVTSQGWPDWITWDAKPIKKRCLRVTFGLAGRLTIGVNPYATADQIATYTRTNRRAIIAKAAKIRDEGPLLVTKELVGGEGFRFDGRSYKLRPVLADGRAGERYTELATAHPGVPCIDEPGPSTWSGVRTWQLTLMYGRPAADIIAWYRRKGQELLDKRMPDLLARVGVDPSEWTWVVRPGKVLKKWGGSWGNCHTGRKRISFDWTVFQQHSAELHYSLAHEAAHAHPDARGHGREWQRRLSYVCPDWERYYVPVTRGTGMVLWTGETTTPAALTLAERRALEAPAPAPAALAPAPVRELAGVGAPFVSGWGSGEFDTLP